jgi:hypothetical protein
VPPAQRAVWITENCADDAGLRNELQRLLAADTDAQADEFLESPINAVDTGLFRDSGETTIDYAPGSRQFGPYRLLRLIGQGGMGEVHLAERGDGAFEQRVALKLLPHPTPGLMQRFRQERQILAHLEHPDIARLLDGGIGENNIPYFAMEYVEGVPVTQFATTQKLDISTTLRLFIRICDAVQYAHRNLVVHRDLKPSNILVTADGSPKLLDFGIAKVLQATGETDATQTAARVFTPDYAAPEQIRGDAITTATDVYALGIILYEVLAGARPYRLGVRKDSLEQAILQVDPAPPSAVLDKSRSDAPQRRRQLRGDLDRIALTALAKEPERRYSSPEMLAADIRRYLDGRPIAARGDSAAYRMRKFVRRNRVAVGAAAVVALALVAATGFSLWQAGIARAQAQRAETKSRTAEAVKDYLLSVFSSANPYKTDGKTVTVRDLLEGGLDQVQKKLAGQPQVQAEIYAAFVETFAELDQLVLADRAGHLALDSYHEFLPNDAIEVLRIDVEMAQVQLWSTHMDGLVQRFEGLLARIGERGGDYAELRGEALRLLEITHYRSGSLAEAVTAGEAAVLQFRRLHRQYNYPVGLALYQLALVRLAQGRAGDAATLINEFAVGDRSLVGPQHPGLTTDVTIIGRYLRSVGRLREARELLGAALSARLRQFSPTHSFVLRTRSLLAGAQLDLGEAAQVEPVFADTIRLATAAPNFAADDLADMHYEHAFALIQLNRLDEARIALASALDTIRRQTPQDAPVPLAIAAALADIDRRQGDPSGALAKLDTIIQTQRQRDDRELPASLLAYARAASGAGNPAGAEKALVEARAALGRQGRASSAIAREIEIERAALPNNAANVTAHLVRAAEIGCINFDCNDERALNLIHHAASVDGKPATAEAIAKLTAQIKQSEIAQNQSELALYGLATDIVAKANSAAGAAH